MAMRLAVILEAYASACSEFIADNSGKETPPDQEYPLWETGLPELSLYPDDTEGWRALNQKLAGRCLNFPNKISGSQAIIRSTIDYAMEDLEDTLNEEAAKRGLEAWSLARELRKQYGVEGADPVWDYAEGLAKTLGEAKSAKSKRAMEHAEFMKEFFPPEAFNK
jgi:hypothetical protein